MAQFGLVYCATGQKYLRLARASIASFRAAGGEAPIQVFCDAASASNIDGDAFSNGTTLTVLEGAVFGFSDKISALLRADFDNGVFVDCDTFFPQHPDKSMGKLFEDELRPLLSHFDLVARPGFSLNTESEAQIAPRSIGQFNTGVIGFRRSERFDSFLKSWADSYEITDPHDQPAFRKAALVTDVRIGPLMPEYNFDGHGLLNFFPRLLHFTGGPRKLLSLEPRTMRDIANGLSSKAYPLLLADFEEVEPLPSLERKILGARLNWYLKGVKLWIASRLEMVTRGTPFRKSF